MRPSDQETMTDNFTAGEARMQSAIAAEGSKIGTRSVARRLPALAVLGFGLVMLFAVGFSEFSAVHNSAHDTRHAAGFPCH
jgi:cobalt transporter subunit CbtB